ncbi:DUF4870 domain-containing protein [Archangium violaceum]|uniref:DUF4870 domain-containing protein n=1 Tax=Archangium violaceum TaxID=83451 RepID=UPI00193C632B|nr:DUF4870 domain-containing protein [Archangium violaceum]QRK07102.1 DUF4870 domain-containing protein [Archangium violaceum]
MDVQQQAGFITGSPAPTADEKTWGMLAHLSALVAALLSATALSFVGPLLVLILKGKDSAWVAQHAKRALNFQILICAVVWACGATCVLLPVAIVVGLVGALFSILAGLKANEGQMYRYPIDLQIVK